MQNESNGKMPAPPPPLVAQIQPKETPTNANGGTHPQVPAPDPTQTSKEKSQDSARLEAETKRFASERRKFSELKAAQEKEWAGKQELLKELEEWKQARANFKRNPVAFLKKELGDNYYDTLTQVHLNGVPTADLVASEMDSRLSDFEKKLQEKDAALDRRFEELQTKEQERLRADFFNGVVSDVKKNLSKYPGLEAFHDDESVFFQVCAEIDSHFQKNQTAIVGGEMEMLTPDEAASIVNKRIEALEARFDAAKRKRQSAAQQPPEQHQRSVPATRRTLSTDITATSGTELVPPKDEKERLARSWAAYEAARRR